MNRSGRINNRSALAAGFAVLTLQFMPSSSQAQWNGPNSQQPNQRPSAAALNLSNVRPTGQKDTSYRDTVELKDKPNISAMPSYPGQMKFINGWTSPHVQGGPTYDINVTTMEKPDQVISWYKQALNGGEWKIDSDQPNSVMAESKRGNTMVVNVMKCPPKYRAYTFMHIMFHDVH